MAVDDLVSASTEVHVYSVFYLPFQKIGSSQKVVMATEIMVNGLNQES